VQPLLDDDECLQGIALHAGKSSSLLDRLQLKVSATAVSFFLADKSNACSLIHTWNVCLGMSAHRVV
jgi:hypothetical protein